MITHTLTGLAYNYSVLNRLHIYRRAYYGEQFAIMHRNAVKLNNHANRSVIHCDSPHNILGADATLAPRCMNGAYWRAKRQSPVSRGRKRERKITLLTTAFQNAAWRRHVRGWSQTSNFTVNKNAAGWCVGGRSISLGGNNPRWAPGAGVNFTL